MKPLVLVTILTAAFLSSQARAQSLLFDHPAFTNCEAQAFSALIIARDAMHLKGTKESQLSVRANEDFVIATIEEVYKEIEQSGSTDHGGFAARKFYECAKREKLPVAERLSAATVCLARQDIVFYANKHRQSGLNQDETRSRIKNYLNNRSKFVYPEALIDQLVPMVYRVQTSKEDYEVRRLVFETCLFPDDWNAWFKVVSGDRK